MSTMRIVHLSDFHYDRSPELRASLAQLIDAAAELKPDVVVVTGDLSADGRPEELAEVAAELRRLDPVPRVVIPGNRDLEPSAGPPGEARAVPVDSDLDFFLAHEPALTLGFGENGSSAPSPEDAWIAQFGELDAAWSNETVSIVGLGLSARVRQETVERAARRLRKAPRGSIRILALHYGLLPVPGRKIREADFANRAGDLLALLLDLGVDLALHGHIHRAHAWQISDGKHGLVVASAGALVNDARSDASFLEVVVEDGRLEIWRRSIAAGSPTLLYEGAIGNGGATGAPAPRETKTGGTRRR
jgi:predicted phosphodiesterase